MAKPVVVAAAIISLALAVAITASVLTRPDNHPSEEIQSDNDLDEEDDSDRQHRRHEKHDQEAVDRIEYETSHRQHVKEDNKTPEELFTEHLHRVRKFRCHDPRPRAFALEELKPEAIKGSWIIGPGEDAYPRVTVLHRCDKYSGCCLSDGKFCYPVGIEEVTLVFRVMEPLLQSNNVRLEKVYVANHTKCGCENLSDSPK